MLALLILAQGEIAGRVDGRPIMWSDVEKRLPDGATDDLRYATLRRMIEEQLFVQAAERAGLSVSESDIDAQLERDIERTGGEAKFRNVLRGLNLSLAEYREWLRTQILVDGLQAHASQAWVRDDAWPALHEIISPEEVREYYRLHTSDFAAVDEIAVLLLEVDADDRRLVHSIRRKAEAGSDFRALAALYGDGAEIRRTVTSDSTIGRTVADLGPGDLTPVFEAGGRLALARVESVRRRDPLTLGEATATIRSILGHERRNANRARLRDDLLGHAEVEPIDLFR